MLSSTFSVIQKCLPVCFDKAEVSLEFREFTVNSQVASELSQNCDALAFWLTVLKMKYPMEEPKYFHLATLAFELVAIPASTAKESLVWYEE